MRDSDLQRIRVDIGRGPNGAGEVVFGIVGTGATRLRRVLSVTFDGCTAPPERGYCLAEARCINQPAFERAQRCPGAGDSRCCGAQKRPDEPCGKADWRPYEDTEWYGREIESACQSIEQACELPEVDRLIELSTWLGVLISEMEIKTAWDGAVARAEAASEALARAGRMSRKGDDRERVRAVQRFLARNSHLSKESAYRYVAGQLGCQPGTVKKVYLRHLKEKKKLGIQN
jgi:hypothetical protein